VSSRLNIRMPYRGLLPIRLNDQKCLRERPGNSQINAICYSAVTNIIVADFIKMSLLIFVLNRLTLIVLNSILSNNTILKRTDLNNLKLCLPLAGSDYKKSALTHRLIRFLEIEIRNTSKSRPIRAFYSVSNK
jgi:hypothetical protein